MMYYPMPANDEEYEKDAKELTKIRRGIAELRRRERELNDGIQHYINKDAKIYAGNTKIEVRY